MLIKVSIASYDIYLESTSSIIDHFQLSDSERCGHNQKQFLEFDDSKSQSSSSFQTSVDVFKKLGLSQALFDCLRESLADPYNHQCGIYYVQTSIEEVVRYSPQENCLAILQLCFEKDIARELKTNLDKYSLLKHQSLEYWMCLYVEYVNDQANNKQKIKNTREEAGKWLTSIAGTASTGTRRIDCINLRSENVDSFFREDSKLRLLVENGDCWFHGTSKGNANNIKEYGIITQDGKPKQDFSHSQGFYLNPNFTDAKDWALKKCRGNPFRNIEGAVLIYRFSRDRYKSVELFRNREKWKRVVKYYRSGMRYYISPELKGELQNVEYIIGQIAEAKPQGENLESWIPTAFHGSSQLCIKADSMAREVSETLEAIIYLIP